MMSARVLIADDHAVVRAGLRQMLAEDNSVGEIGEAATGQQTLERLREGNWELLILDIGMPDRSGMDILRHVRSGYPGAPVRDQHAEGGRARFPRQGKRAG
jgi:two-component system invasion response regulator UvrY